MKKVVISSVLFLVILISQLKSQKDFNNWYFGNHAGITFNTPNGSPKALTGSSIYTYEGCSAISDTSSNLLFYTDGRTVWNKFNNEMPNGTGLNSDIYAAQGVIIIPKPGDNNIYYVFTTDYGNGDKGLNYSIVDMSLQYGLGDVTQKNIQLIKPTTENVYAIKHGNCNDYWVITHTKDNNTFYVYLVNSQGVSKNPVLSSVGTTYDTPLDYTTCYNSTRDGKKLSACIYTKSTLEIYDFDNMTGIITNPLDLYNPDFYFLYDAEFSPDQTKLYATSRFGPSRLYQFDLSAGSPQEILKSQVIIATDPAQHYYGTLQTGPDGKIYHAKQDAGYLGVINNPNAKGLACNYNDNGVSLGGATSFIGLPSHVINSCLDTATLYPHITVIHLGNPCSGDTVILEATDGYSFYGWYDADNNKLLYSGSRRFTVPESGKYYVKVRNGSGNEGTSETVDVSIGSMTNQIVVTSPLDNGYFLFDSTELSQTKCQKIQLTNTSDVPFTLNEVSLEQNKDFSIPGTQFPIIFNSGETKELTICFTASDLGEQTETLTFKDTCSTQTILLKATPTHVPITLMHTGKPCDTDTVILETVTGFILYNWYDATTNQIVFTGSNRFSVVNSGKYYVKVQNANGNEGMSKNVNVTLRPTVTNQIIVTSPLTNGNFIFDKNYLNQTNAQKIQLTNTSSEPFTLNDVSLEKNTNFSVPTDQFPIIFNPGATKELVVTYLATDLMEQIETITFLDTCSKQTITLTATVAHPVISLTHIGKPCTGDTVVLETNSGFTLYEWYDATTNQLLYSDSKKFTVTSTGKYYVKVKDGNGNESSSDNIDVNISTANNQIVVSSPLTDGNFVFDNNYLNQTNSQKIQLTNISNVPFVLNNVNLEKNVSFTIPVSQFPITFNAGETKDLIVDYNPTLLGEQSETIIFNDTCTQQTILLTATGAHPTITLSHTGKPCSSDTVILVTNDGFAFYDWYDATTNQIVYSDSKLFPTTTSGKYYVKVRDDNGNEGTSDNIDVNITWTSNQIAITADLTGGSYVFDKNYLNQTNSQKIKLTNVSDLPFTLISASLNQNNYFQVPLSQFPITFNPSETKDLIVDYTPAELGIQTDILAFNDLCSKQTINITANGAQPIVTLSRFGKSCNGDTVVLTTNVGFTSYDWYDSETNTVILSGTNKSYFTTPGTFNVKVTDNKGTEATSDDMKVAIDSVRNAIVINSDLSTGYYNIDSTTMSQTNCKIIQLTNNSDIPFTLDDVSLNHNTCFTVPLAQLPLYFNSGESKDLIVCYSPTAIGTQVDTLIFNDICTPHTIFVQAVGTPDIYTSGGTDTVNSIYIIKTIPEYFSFNVTDPFVYGSTGEFKVTYKLTHFIDSQSSAECSIYSTLGEKLLVGAMQISSQRIINKNMEEEKGSYIFDIHDLQSGLYFVVMQSNGEVMSCPIIIER